MSEVSAPSGDHAEVSESYDSGDFIADHKILPIAAPSQLPTPAPVVLIAILAKQKESSLPFYLECLELLDYPKDRIVLYIRTNNNTDATKEILEQWRGRIHKLYRAVEMDATDVEEKVEEFGVHEWNATRFKVLSRIRETSLNKVFEYGCDYYFTVDVDAFVRRETLKELIAADRAIVAPFLRAIVPTLFYSNFFCAVDENGYYSESAEYKKILWRNVKDLNKVPLVHIAYLIKREVLPLLRYDDGSGRHEFVVLADSARRGGVDQFLDNRHVYGYITHDDSNANFEATLSHQTGLARSLLSGAEVSDGTGKAGLEIGTDKLGELERRFSSIYDNNTWVHGSGHGSLPINNLPYMKFVESFIVHNDVKSVVDLGCGDWQFSRYIDWSCTEYLGVDLVEKVVEGNRRKFGTGNVTFDKFQSVESLPDGDLLLCKDVLQHLSNVTVEAYIRKLLRKFAFLLITNDDLPADWLNADIAEGEFRPLRLDRAPFGLPATSIFCWDLVWTQGGMVPPRKLVQLLRGEQRT